MYIKLARSSATAQYILRKYIWQISLLLACLYCGNKFQISYSQNYYLNNINFMLLFIVITNRIGDCKTLAQWCGCWWIYIEHGLHRVSQKSLPSLLRYILWYENRISIKEVCLDRVTFYNFLWCQTWPHWWPLKWITVV